MKTRLITAAVGIPLLIGLFILSEFYPIALVILISIANTIMCGEYLSAKKLHTDLKISIPSMAFACVYPLLSYFDLQIIPFFLFILSFVVLLVVFHEKIQTEDLMFAYGGNLIFTELMSMMAIRSCSEGRYVSFWIVIFLGVPWIADSSAYFVGRYLGKHKLCPKISPHKTIEGAVGGVVGGILGSVIIGLVFMLIYRPIYINIGYLAIIGVVNSVVSIFGDLTFSVLKRHCGIKDYGSIVPGHGGLLDRMDSVIFCIPTVLIMSHLFTVIAPVTPAG